jgi:hypothetical protein
MKAVKVAKAKPKSQAVLRHEEKMLALRDLEVRGRITPTRLVDAAQSPDHVWHDSFEWNDSKAAAKYRIDTAREIIRTWVAPRVVGETVERRTVVYVRDPRLPNSQQGYVSIEKVRTDKSLIRDVLVAEFSRAAASLQRAYDVADILNARHEIKDLVEKVNRLRERSEAVKI